MGIRRDVNAPPLIEPIPLTEIFATGLAPVDHCGEYVRLTFYSERDLGQGDIEHVAVAVLVLPNVAFHRMARKVTDIPLVPM